MFNSYLPSARRLIAIVAAALTVSACGGGGTSVAGGVGSGGTGFASGSVVKGPVGNSTVTAYAIANGQMGAPIGTSTTDANGNFNMAIGTYTGSVMLKAIGGTYTDEATGTVMPMATGDVMTAVVPMVAAGASTAGIQLTPVTAMAQSMAQYMTGGMTDANIAAANLAMGSHFSVSDILHVQPMNPLVANSGTAASLDAQNYGMTLAAMSKYSQTLGLTASSSMVSAMMSDAMDGVLDGKAAGAQIQMGGMGMGGSMMLPANAATSGLGAAMNAFMNSAQNKSGVKTTDLVNKLNGPTGQMPVPVTARATVSGTAFNGPVSSGMMTAYAVNGGVMGAQIASVAVDTQGNFTMPLGDYSGPMMLQLTDATYKDLASNLTMTMAPNEVMTAAIESISSGANVSGVVVTPLTAMAQSRALGMAGGMTPANISAANVAMGAYFGVSDILHTSPMNPGTAGAASTATQDARDYGMALAGMSAYAKSLNLPTSSTFMTAMMKDVADGVLDGKIGTTPISMPMGSMMGSNTMSVSAGTTGLVTAMTNFMNSSANLSGVTVADMLAFMQKFINAGGKI